MDKRLKNYKIIDKILKKEKIEEKCELKPFIYRQIGSKSLYGVVYRLSYKSDESYKSNDNKHKIPDITVKAMDSSKKDNVDEVFYYKKLRNYTIKKITPHFPLVWESIFCKDKCTFLTENPGDIKKWSENYCYLLFSELFNGDLRNYAESIKNQSEIVKTKKTISLLVQVMMGLYTLEKNNLAHGDLHTQNVLYYNIKNKDKDKNKKYIKYTLQGETYYVPHFSKIFVLWDFGKMRKIGLRADHSKDWLKKNNFPEFNPINSIIWDLCIFTDALKYFIYLIGLKNKDIYTFIKHLRSHYISYAIKLSKGENNDKVIDVKYFLDELIYELSYFFKGTEIENFIKYNEEEKYVISNYNLDENYEEK